MITPPVPTTIADVLRALVADPGRPRVTWYGDGGERVELSGAVLENWVNKTTNLLVEEFDVAPDVNVLLDLPIHWRTIVWGFAVWRAGACVSTSAEPLADLVVTDSPARHPEAASLVAVSLPALARRFDGSLPPGAVDAASAVATYADTLGWVPPLDLGAPALRLEDRTVTHRELVRPDGPSATRTLLQMASGAPVPDFLLDVLALLAAHGSVVVVAGEMARELRTDPGRRDRLIAGERITAVQADVP